MGFVIHLLTTAAATVFDVAPIVAILVFFQVVVLRRPIPNLRRTLLGFVYVLIGLTLFLDGLDLALFPLGRSMAQQLTAPGFIGADPALGIDWRDYGWVYAFAFLTGFASAMAEPALIAVSLKAQEISGGTIAATGLRVAVGLGAACGVTLGTFRVVQGYPLHWLVLAGYGVVLVQTLFAPRAIIPLAYDAGGVTTSTVTVPLVTALGLGLATQLPGRSPLLDGFGMIALTCLFPMITVMGYAQAGALAARLGRRRAPAPPPRSRPSEKTP